MGPEELLILLYIGKYKKVCRFTGPTNGDRQQFSRFDGMQPPINLKHVSLDEDNVRWTLDGQHCTVVGTLS